MILESIPVLTDSRLCSHSLLNVLAHIGLENCHFSVLRFYEFQHDNKLFVSSTLHKVTILFITL